VNKVGLSTSSVKVSPQFGYLTGTFILVFM